MDSAQPVPTSTVKLLTYSAHEAAEIIGISDKTMLAWIKAGRVCAVKERRRWVVPAHVLGLLPQSPLARAHYALKHGGATNDNLEHVWRVGLWRRIAEAALVIHADALLGGCACQLCQALWEYARGVDATP
jgi:hypothetical protein